MRSHRLRAGWASLLIVGLAGCAATGGARSPIAGSPGLRARLSSPSPRMARASRFALAKPSPWPESGPRGLARYFPALDRARPAAATATAPAPTALADASTTTGPAPRSRRAAATRSAPRPAADDLPMLSVAVAAPVHPPDADDDPPPAAVASGTRRPIPGRPAPPVGDDHPEPIVGERLASLETTDDDAEADPDAPPPLVEGPIVDNARPPSRRPTRPLDIDDNPDDDPILAGRPRLRSLPSERTYGPGPTETGRPAAPAATPATAPHPPRFGAIRRKVDALRARWNPRPLFGSEPRDLAQGR